jgi:DNA repair photolyase
MDTIIVKNLIHSVQSGQSWFGVTHNTNIYRGCHHDCIYCDSRSSCYQISNFDQVRVKKDACIKIDQELKSKRKKGVLGFGGMNDPYNTFESKMEYTRQALQAVNKYQFGAHIITKSTLVIRDIDLFQSIQEHSIMNVGITITTADDRLQSRIERNVSSTSKRFEALRILREHEIYAGILMMPILPFINDTIDNIERIVYQAKKADASYIYPSFGVTLRDNQRQYFLEQIGPDLAKQYIDAFGHQYMCVSPNEKQLRARFEELCEQYQIPYKMKDIVEGSRQHIKAQQQTLF